MITVSVPTADDRELLAGLLADADDDAPDDAGGNVEILVWDGHTDRPEGADRIAVFVGRYDKPPPAAEVLAGLPALQVIQLLSAGVEPWLPVVPKGVVLCNGRGIHGSSTAELAVAGLLALLRDLPAYLEAQRERRWDRLDSAGLAGASVLVLGAGDIGRRIGDIAAILDAEVTYVARTARDGVRSMDELDALLPGQQVVVVAIPLTDETQNLVDAAFLAALPDGAVLVNISRGRHVDTDALLAELTTGRLRAYLDVTEPEPLPADHPLWAAPNLILTPHVGGGTSGWGARAFALVADQLGRLRDGDTGDTGDTGGLVNRVEGGY